MFSTDSLLVSLVWSAVGAGCLVYGKKQSVAPALLAGLALLAASCIPSPLLMSAVALLLLTAMVWAIRRGY